MRRPSAAQVLEGLLDAGSFVSWDVPTDLDHPSYADPAYVAEIAKARVTAGTDEAVITGHGRVGGRPVAVIISEFSFLAGSIGAATAERIIAAIHRATAEELPLLAAPCSGGTRMQEGTPAFVRMIGITRALVAHKRARLPYVVYLRHPTTGGVLASWGSTGHVTFAEPEATVGFLGPRVVEALTGAALPAHVQTSKHLAERGIIDAVLTLDEMRATLSKLLTLTEPSVRPVPTHATSLPRKTSPDAWNSVTLTRRPDRPGARELIALAGAETLELSGTGRGETSAAIIVAVTALRGRPCVVVAQDRRAQAKGHALDPASLRVAQRGICLAEELGLPLVTVIDTPGAELSVSAEENAMAGEIARCVTALESLTVPRVSVMLGEGCGGGALALLAADRVLAAEHAWLSPLSPEGASFIVHRTDEHAAAMARRQRIRAVDLHAEGSVDEIIEEGDVARNPSAFLGRVADACERHLDELSTVTAAFGSTGSDGVIPKMADVLASG